MCRLRGAVCLALFFAVTVSIREMQAQNVAGAITGTVADAS